jgi:hypothetical protein
MLNRCSDNFSHMLWWSYSWVKMVSFDLKRSYGEGFWPSTLPYIGDSEVLDFHAGAAAAAADPWMRNGGIRGAMLKPCPMKSSPVSLCLDAA